MRRIHLIPAGRVLADASLRRRSNLMIEDSKSQDVHALIPCYKMFGMKFGKLLILKEPTKIVYGRPAFKCQCDCGNIVWVNRFHIRNGHTRSCGCYAIKFRTKHGMTHSKEWQSWKDMRTRCYNPKHISFKNYGSRGITVCPSWRNSFETFYSDMGPKPIGFTLERKDVNKGYSKSNCKWATWEEQSTNKRKCLSS